MAGRSLAAVGQRDGPLIVLAQEHDRRLEDPGEVHGLAEIALRRGALAETGQHGGRFAPLFGGPRQSHRVQHVGAHRYRRGEHAHAFRYDVAPLVAAPVLEVLLHAHAPHQEDARLAERRHHPILVAKGEGRPEVGGFLPRHPREGPQPTLALQLEHALVEPPGEHHPAVELLHAVGGEIRHQGRRRRSHPDRAPPPARPRTTPRRSPASGTSSTLVGSSTRSRDQAGSGPDESISPARPPPTLGATDIALGSARRYVACDSVYYRGPGRATVSQDQEGGGGVCMIRKRATTATGRYPSRPGSAPNVAAGWARCSA